MNLFKSMILISNIDNNENKVIKKIYLSNKYNIKKTRFIFNIEKKNFSKYSLSLLKIIFWL